jgi:hypothetical protein
MVHNPQSLRSQWKNCMGSENMDEEMLRALHESVHGNENAGTPETVGTSIDEVMQR